METNSIKLDFNPAINFIKAYTALSYAISTNDTLQITTTYLSQCRLYGRLITERALYNIFSDYVIKNNIEGEYHKEIKSYIAMLIDTAKVNEIGKEK